MRSWATTSRYSPVNHIRIGPPGVSISMPTRRAPPTRTSIFATTIVAPAGPYHAEKCSGSVHSLQSSSTGAGKQRSITTACSATSFSVIVLVRSGRWHESCQVVVHPVEAGLPVGPAALRPGRDLVQWRRIQRTRSELGPASPNDQPSPFQHLDVLGDRRERHRERLGQLVD